MLDMNKQPNPYFLGLYTAILSGTIAIVGFYYTAKFQSDVELKKIQYELKARSYMSFLSSLDRKKSPIIAEILNIGSVSEHVVTDSEIQALEDSLGRLIKMNKEYGISWQISSDFTVLKLNGSELVQQYCEDILAVLALREHSVDWSIYSSKLQKLREAWKSAQKGTSIGWIPRVSPEERVMFVLISEMYENLINQLNEELSEKI